MDDDLLFAKIKDIIVKTFISVEPLLNSSFQMNVPHRNNCFQVFGFDIMVDYRLNPWLLEVNLSPSMACDSPLDMSIKSNLVCDAFNIMGVKRFDRKKESLNKIKHRMKGLYNKGGSKKSGLGNGIQGSGLNGNMMGSEIFGGQSTQ